MRTKNRCQNVNLKLKYLKNVIHVYCQHEFTKVSKINIYRIDLWSECKNKYKGIDKLGNAFVVRTEKIFMKCV